MTDFSDDIALMTALIMADHLDKPDGDALVARERAKVKSPWGSRGLAAGRPFIRRGFDKALGAYAIAYADGAEEALIAAMAAVSLPEAEGRAAEVLLWVKNGMSHAEIRQRLRAGDDEHEADVIAFPGRR